MRSVDFETTLAITQSLLISGSFENISHVVDEAIAIRNAIVEKVGGGQWD